MSEPQRDGQLDEGQFSSDPRSPAPSRVTLWGLFQLLTAIGVMCAVGLYYGIFWVIISVPVLFAAIAAINFSDAEPGLDLRLKRWMRRLTLLACSTAWFYEYGEWLLFEFLHLDKYLTFVR